MKLNKAYTVQAEASWNKWTATNRAATFNIVSGGVEATLRATLRAEWRPESSRE